MNNQIYKCCLHLRDESNIDNYDLGHAYLYKKDNILILYRGRDSTRHLNKLENIQNILTFDMEDEIPDNYYNKIIESFLLNGFDSNTCYNYSMFDLFKKNAKHIFNSYKDRIKLLKDKK